MSDESADDQLNGLQSSSSISLDFSDVRSLSHIWMNSDGNLGDVTDECSDKEVDKFRQLFSESDYALLMREYRKEYQRPKPLRQQIKTLLKKSFANRQKEIEKMEAEGVSMMSSIMVH